MSPLQVELIKTTPSGTKLLSSSLGLYNDALSAVALTATLGTATLLLPTSTMVDSLGPQMDDWPYLLDTLYPLISPVET